MDIRDIPSRIERSHGYPITHERLCAELSSADIAVPDGPDQPAATLLDACDEYGFAPQYETAADLRAALFCAADATHVGRVGYDDRGHNPAWDGTDQVSF